jgi:hypothetical protein
MIRTLTELTVWCSRERLPAAAVQPAQGSSEPVAPRIYLFFILLLVPALTRSYEKICLPVFLKRIYLFTVNI